LEGGLAGWQAFEEEVGKTLADRHSPGNGGLRDHFGLRIVAHGF
jgi:hypothetical protein